MPHSSTRYSTFAESSRRETEAIAHALTTLTNCGFRIEHKSDDTATVTGPGLNSSRQNPLLGATKVHLNATDGRLKLDAELGGVDRMVRFVKRFPPMLGLGLGLFFAVATGLMAWLQLGAGNGVPWARVWRWIAIAFVTSLAPVAPWLFLSPIIARSTRRRTEQALDTLVHNAVMQ
ncbi:hypothetical protein [Planctomycetes bacterium K23_9]